MFPMDEGAGADGQGGSHAPHRATGTEGRAGAAMHMHMDLDLDVLLTDTPSSDAPTPSDTDTGTGTDTDGDGEGGWSRGRTGASSSTWSFADFFLALPGHDFFVRIPAAFITDDFNLFELADVFRCPLQHTDARPVPGRAYTRDFVFADVVRFVLVERAPRNESLHVPRALVQDAFLLYYLLHQRFLVTRAGMAALHERVRVAAFGSCPRVLCAQEALLPLGPSVLPRRSPLRLYCPNCQDLYVPGAPVHAKLDGCAWGPTAAHLLCRAHLHADARAALEARACQPWPVYVPRIYGFRLAKCSGSDAGSAGSVGSAGSAGGAGTAGATGATGATGAHTSTHPSIHSSTHPSTHPATHPPTHTFTHPSTLTPTAALRTKPRDYK